MTTPLLRRLQAVVYQHESSEGLGLLEPALHEAGFACTTRFRTVAPPDRDADLVVVLGGPMGVYEADRYPFLAQELEVLRERLAQDRPCLGICLGAQLLAKAGGADVFPGKNGFELGAAPVVWTDAARADPHLAPPGPETWVSHWHGDTYSAVPGSTLLASTKPYPHQAFRLGSSYGFQFHLELTADALEGWLSLHGRFLSATGIDTGAVRRGLAQLRGSEPLLRALCAKLASGFASKSAGVAARTPCS